MLRTGFLKGALRRLWSVPRLILFVRGWPGLLADCLGLRQKPYVVRARNGATCELRPGASDWWIFLEIFVFGIYRRVEDDIRQSRTIVDIGANVGLFAIFAASLNRETQIHAFEPFPKNVEQMNRNLLLDRGANQNVRVYPDAVADRTGTMTLYFTPGDDSGCSLNQVKDHSVTVPTLGVNELFKQCGIEKCDLLKVDCEGSELPILQAASAQVLGAIRTIILEYHAQADVEPLTGLLSRAGFKCELLPRINTLYATRR